MKTLLPLLACCMLAGCTTLPYHPPQFLENDARFPGLVDVAADAPGRHADVLLVHGMCTHDVRWADDTVAQLSTALRAQLGTSPAAPAAVGDGIAIISRRLPLPQGELRFQALLWSPLTTPLKHQLDYDHSDRVPARRARLNGTLKDGLIDDCIADALVYQGVARDTLRQRMREAILRATADQSADAPLVVLSSSLGSKILFDTLLQMLEEPATRAAAQRTADRLSYLVMAANQIPLLSLADQPLPGAALAAAGPPDSLLAVLRQRRAPAVPRAPLPQLVLVAFTDPNDLLSYTLPRERYAGAGVQVFNVLVSNAPGWFGLLERPDQAHGNYLRNPDVARLVACGQPRSARCN